MENRSPGKLDCRLVKNWSICSGYQILPGTHFTKIWRLRNTGTLPWPHNTQLVKCAGSVFRTGNDVKLEIPEQGFPVNEDFDAVVHFIAPMHPGRYFTSWRLMAPSGLMFGQQVWFNFQVLEFSKEGALRIPDLKSVLTTKHPAGSFQGQGKQRLLGERVLPHPMKPVQTTKDTDGNGPSTIAPIPINDSASMVAPIQLQGVGIDTVSARDGIELAAAVASKFFSHLLAAATESDATESDPSLETALQLDLSLP